MAGHSITKWNSVPTEFNWPKLQVRSGMGSLELVAIN